eukprot:327831-Chlamydomonas_euryale.AAC.1
MVTSQTTREEWLKGSSGLPAPGKAGGRVVFEASLAGCRCGPAWRYDRVSGRPGAGEWEKV